MALLRELLLAQLVEHVELLPEVQGHGPNERKTIAGRRHVGMLGLEPVGNYAVRILFDDLHDTGIFSWDYLHELGRERATKWQAYLDALHRQGLSRDP